MRLSEKPASATSRRPFWNSDIVLEKAILKISERGGIICVKTTVLSGCACFPIPLSGGVDTIPGVIWLFFGSSNFTFQTHTRRSGVARRGFNSLFLACTSPWLLLGPAVADWVRLNDIQYKLVLIDRH